jgi:hypothetical protein
MVPWVIHFFVGILFYTFPSCIKKDRDLLPSLYIRERRARSQIIRKGNNGFQTIILITPRYSNDDEMLVEFPDRRGIDGIWNKRTNIRMGPVGFEPTTASAPGFYLIMMRWYPGPS